MGMKPIFKLFIKYILIKIPYTFIYFNAQKNNNLNIFLSNNALLYLTIHLKFSSIFYSSQLSDILAYELPLVGSKPTTNNKPLINLNNMIRPSIIVYNFHSMFFHNRIFLFTQHTHQIIQKKIQNNYYTLNSISEIFPAGN